MTNTAVQIKRKLKSYAKPEKVAIAFRYFKTGKGEYGEGDKFLGVVMPDQRKVAKEHRDLPFVEVQKLLESVYHEHRMTGFLILTYKFEKADEQLRREIYDFFYKNRKYANNWDLVDVIVPKIMGVHLLDKKRNVLYKLARSKSLWDRRISIISTFEFIRHDDFEYTLKIAEILVNDKHDLIHKAVGWMLREIGKRDSEAERKFLRKYHKIMPRVMYRYAIERGVTEK